MGNLNALCIIYPAKEALNICIYFELSLLLHILCCQSYIPAFSRVCDSFSISLATYKMKPIKIWQQLTTPPDGFNDVSDRVG